MLCRKLLFTLFVFSSYLASAQETPLKFLSIEMGMDFISCKKVDHDYIRGEKPSLYVEEYGYSSGIQSQMYKAYGGVKIELRFRDDKFGFLTGIRFTRLTSTITKDNAPEYFYMVHRQTGTTTEYLRVRELAQVSNYLGVPVELRIFPWRPRFFRMYFLAGGEISCRVSTNNKADFVDSSMDKYTSDVSGIIGRPDALSANFYGRFGVIIGKEKPIFNIGITVPVLISTSSSTLNSPSAGGGFHVQIQKPF